jgi:hypothetical protein
MALKRASVRDGAEPFQIQVEVSLDGGKKVFVEPAPEGFPPELFPHLADFWKRGFNATIPCSDTHSADQPVKEVSLAEFAEPRGRPIDDESEREGREAAKLRREGLSFGQIALRVCRHRNERRHRCKKPCNDRIRQAMQQYESREELKKIARGDLDS